VALVDAGTKLIGNGRMIGELELELEARGEAVDRGVRRVAELERVATRLAERVVERERDLRTIRVEAAALRSQGDQGSRALAALADELEAIRRQARGQATRIRMRALREVAELTEAGRELARDPEGASGRLTDSLRDALARIGAGDDFDDPGEELAASNGHAERVPGELFDGLVEVEIGPLSDFSQLVGFEDAAAGIGASSEISVKRFTQGRATLAIRFKQPVELLRELEERAPFVFRVRDMRADRLVLDVDG
jgi:hypothetical protein